MNYPFNMNEMLYRELKTENRDNNDALAMVFINMQPLETLYSTEEAFSNGTLFENLNKPFYGGRARC